MQYTSHIKRMTYPASTTHTGSKAFNYKNFEKVRVHAHGIGTAVCETLKRDPAVGLTLNVLRACGNTQYDHT